MVRLISEIPDVSLFICFVGLIQFWLYFFCSSDFFFSFLLVCVCFVHRDPVFFFFIIRVVAFISESQVRPTYSKLKCKSLFTFWNLKRDSQLLFTISINFRKVLVCLCYYISLANRVSEKLKLKLQHDLCIILRESI